MSRIKPREVTRYRKLVRAAKRYVTPLDLDALARELAFKAATR